MLEILIILVPAVIAVIAYRILNSKINWKKVIVPALLYIAGINLIIAGALYIMGIRRFNLFEMGLSFKAKWIILEIIFSAAVTVIYWNITSIYKQKLSVGKQVKRLFPAVLFLTVTYAIFTPSSLFLGNIEEFSVSYIKILPIILTYAAVLIICVYIAALCFTNEKSAFYSVAIIFSLALGTYVQGNFLNPVFPTLDGTEINWSDYAHESGVSIAFWILCIVVIVVLAHLFKEKAEQFIKYASYFFSAIQVITLIVLILTSSLGESVDHGLAKEGEFSLGSEKNVVLFIIDTLQADAIDEYISSDAYIEGALDDFTFFENTVAGGAATRVAVPLLLTGVEYDPAQPMEEYKVSAWEETPLYEDLHANGYDVRFYTSIRYVSGYTDEMVDNYEVTGAHWIGDYPEFGLQLCKLASFYLMPQPLKKYFWLSTDAMTDVIESSNSGYSIDDVGFYEDLQAAGSIKTDYDKAFRVYHLNGVHKPRKINENIERIKGLEGDGLPEQQTLQGIMKIVYAYIDEMKKAGVYDNSTIIIAGDHGRHGVGNIESNPAVLVKLPGESHALERSLAPLHFRNIVAAMAQNVVDDYSKYGPSVYDIDENSDVERLHTVDENIRNRIEIKEEVDDSLECTRFIISGKADAGEYSVWNPYNINRISYRLGDIIDFKTDNDYAEGLNYRLYKENNAAVASNELSICFELDEFSGKDMEFHFVCSDIYNDSQLIRIYAGGQKAGNITCTKEDIGQEKKVAISSECIQDNKLVIRMVFPGAVTPKQIGLSDTDTRVLSLAFDSMWLSQ